MPSLRIDELAAIRTAVRALQQASKDSAFGLGPMLKIHEVASELKTQGQVEQFVDVLEQELGGHERRQVLQLLGSANPMIQSWLEDKGEFD